MNKEPTYHKSIWPNGQPSIEIAPYDYSACGFGSIIETLQNAYSFDTPEIVRGLEKFMATLQIMGQPVQIDMDNWSCSLAFQTEALRNEVFSLLEKKDTRP